MVEPCRHHERHDGDPNLDDLLLVEARLHSRPELLIVVEREWVQCKALRELADEPLAVSDDPEVAFTEHGGVDLGREPSFGALRTGRIVPLDSEVRTRFATVELRAAKTKR